MMIKSKGFFWEGGGLCLEHKSNGANTKEKHQQTQRGKTAKGIRIYFSPCFQAPCRALVLLLHGSGDPPPLEHPHHRQRLLGLQAQGHLVGRPGGGPGRERSCTSKTFSCTFCFKPLLSSNCICSKKDTFFRLKVRI